MKPYLVSNTLELLAKEIPKLAMNPPSNVQLCFTTDPFMYGFDEICRMSMQAIAMLNNAGIPCTVLTKGILPYELSQLSPYNNYGISLVSLNEEYRRCMEPGAAPFAERIASLRRLHDAGCRTWVSMEPYPTPNIIQQDLRQILESISFVDRIIFGRTNYSTEVSGYKSHKEFYNAMAMEVIQFCEGKGISYHIKDGTITNLPY
jgi:DNA repair photolyase